MIWSPEEKVFFFCFCFFFVFLLFADAGTTPPAWSRQQKIKMGLLDCFITEVAQQLQIEDG
jgi:hypothetical protein